MTVNLILHQSYQRIFIKKISVPKTCCDNSLLGRGRHFSVGLRTPKVVSVRNADMASLKFKYCGITKRVRVEKEISALHFSDIREQATELFPAISGDTLISFVWEDEEGDKVDSSSDKEIQEAVRTMTSLGKPSTFEIQISTSAFSKATIRGETEIKGSAYYVGDHMLKDVVDLSQTISGISREESVLNQMLENAGSHWRDLSNIIRCQIKAGY